MLFQTALSNCFYKLDARRTHRLSKRDHQAFPENTTGPTRSTHVNLMCIVNCSIRSLVWLWPVMVDAIRAQNRSAAVEAPARLSGMHCVHTFLCTQNMGDIAPAMTQLKLVATERHSLTGYTYLAYMRGRAFQSMPPIWADRLGSQANSQLVFHA